MAIPTIHDKACANCGAPLPDDAVAGALCAACQTAENTLTIFGEAGTPEPSASVRSTAPRTLETVGDFEVLGKLGRGGMGTVYRARQVTLDRLVALKILPPQLEEDQNFVSRFQREAQVAAALNHPNLVRVYASGVSHGCHYIAMELVEGENLWQRLKRGGITPAEAVRICRDVAHGLQCGWQRAQLVHRDVKPSNIYLSASGEVKLGDLGLAKSLLSNTTGLTHTGAAIGTPHYISPEQARGDKSIDLRADIYSLGCTLYQLLTGVTPYEGADPLSVMSMHLNSPPPAIMKVLPQCPLPLARLVNKMLRKSRHERHQSYEELIGAMDQVLEQLGQGATTAGPSALVTAWREIGAAEEHGLFVRTSNPAPPTATETSTAPASTRAAKSRLGPWLGLAAALLILGGAAFVILNPSPQAALSERTSKNSAVPLKVTVHGASSSAAATRDQPFINTLGMMFVPVPIIGGPTDGQRVLFSVWETRVQDYDVYAAQQPRLKRVPPGFEQGPTHPEVNVSWDDAQAFCAWLTDRERTFRKIGVGEVFRLPSDHEWSCAAEIGEQEDAATLPDEKTGKHKEVFLWGSGWPPPDKAGNYAGAEVPNSQLSGYRDGFLATAPVGSFAVNPFGVYDLAGNAAEWCEDWYDRQQQRRVLRGASWMDGNRSRLYTTLRTSLFPSSRVQVNSFRVVLAAGSSAFEGAGSRGEAAAGARSDEQAAGKPSR